MSDRQFGVKDVSDGLAQDMDMLVRTLRGDIKLTRRTKGGTVWQYGRKQSLKVHVAGPRRGAWYDFEAGCGGGPLQFVRYELRIDDESALTWARNYLGLDPFGPEQQSDWENRAREREAERSSQDAKHAAAAERKRADGIAEAQRLSAEAVALKGTLGEQYLTQPKEAGGRNIPRPAWAWPDAVRYHPILRALIVCATDDAGNVQCVQIIRLTNDARKIPKSATLLVKETVGPLGGAAVRFFRVPGADDELQVAEGPETGLTVWAANGRETWVTLGPVGSAPIKRRRDILLACDDDGMSAPSKKGRRDAVRKWRKLDCTVVEAHAFETRRHDSSDFNTLAQDRGIDAVRKRIEACLTPSEKAVRRVPVEEARTKLRGAVLRFFAEADQHFEATAGGDETAPPVHALRVSLGVGKSSEARRRAADRLRTMRAAGDDRNIAIATPTHALNDEQAEAFMRLPSAKAAGLTVEVWRGRSAKDPTGDGETMCRDLAAVNLAIEAGADVDAACCKSGKGEGAIKCPLYDVCGYQGQKACGTLLLTPVSHNF